MSDPINPDHYTRYSQEVIDTLEEWVARAPDPVSGVLQFNAGKYLARMWDKGDNPAEHVGKAIWYLQRLRDRLTAEPVPFEPGPLDYGDILQDYAWQSLVNEGPDHGLGDFTTFTVK